MHKASASVGVLLLEQNHSLVLLLTLDNTAYRTVSYRRSFFQVSALSTVVGSVLDYHGANG